MGLDSPFCVLGLVVLALVGCHSGGLGLLLAGRIEMLASFIATTSTPIFH